MNRFFYVIILLGLLTGCQNDTPSEPEDENAEVVLPPEEEDYDIPKFKWGYIDKEGYLVIDAIYDDGRNFNEGLCVVRKGGKWGYINRQGKEVITPEFKAAWDFKEGLARVLTYGNCIVR